jgi:hypothetical protein
MTNGETRVAPNRAGRWRTALGILMVAGLAVVAATLIGGFLFGGYPKPKPQRRFDQTVWKLSDGGDWKRYDDRGRMIDSLLEDHLRLGMTRVDVESLLGQPDHLKWSYVFPHPGYFVASGDGFGCLAGSVCLIWHFGLKSKPASPLPEIASWLALAISLVLLFRVISGKAQIAEAVSCLVAAVALYIAFDFNGPIFGGVPWLLLLLGLVLLWTRLRLGQAKANLIGASMALGSFALYVGLALIDPWLGVYLLLFGVPWLIVVGFAFPLCIGVVENISSRRSQNRQLPQADRGGSTVRKP